MGRALFLMALACVFIALVPMEAALVLGIVGVVILVSGYTAVGAMTGALTLPLLIAVGAGARTPIFGASLAAFVALSWTYRGSLRRLRAGEERRLGSLGNAPLSPGEQPVVGLWTSPAPHGLLGRSALSLGAVLTIAAAVGVSVLVAARFG